MNVALIGCSGMGRVHAEMAANCGLNIAICADKSRKAAGELAKKYGAKVMTDGFKAAAAPNIDIVAIATPTTTHLMFIEAAAKACKHIFCEKPFCRTVAECKKAIAADNKERGKLGGSARDLRKQIKILKSWVRWWDRAANACMEARIPSKKQLEEMIVLLEEALDAIQRG